MRRRTRARLEIRVEPREVVERGVEIGTDAEFTYRNKETLSDLRVWYDGRLLPNVSGALGILDHARGACHLASIEGEVSVRCIYRAHEIGTI